MDLIKYSFIAAYSNYCSVVLDWKDDRIGILVKSWQDDAEQMSTAELLTYTWSLTAMVNRRLSEYRSEAFALVHKH